MKVSQTSAVTTTTTTTKTTPTTVEQINNNTNKTIQPTAQDVHTATGIGAGGISMGIISIISLISGVIYKLLKNKKVLRNLKEVMESLDKDYDRIKAEWKDKKYDILADNTKLNDKKDEEIEKLKQEYEAKLSAINQQKELIKMKGEK